MSPSSVVRLASSANTLSILDLDLSDSNNDVRHVYGYSPTEGTKGSGRGVGGGGGARIIYGSSWSPDGSCLASAVKDGGIVLTYSRKNVFSSSPLEMASSAVSRPPTTVLFPNTTKSSLIIGCPDKVVMFNLTRRKTAKEFPMKAGATLRSMATNFDDNFIAVGTNGAGFVYLFNTLTNSVSSPLKPVDGSREVSAIRYGHRAMLAAAMDTGVINLWDCNTSTRIRSYQDHQAPSTGVAFSPVNDFLVLSTGLDKRCICYDTNNKTCLNIIKTDHPLTAAEVFPDGRKVALGTTTGKLLIYDLRSLVRPVFTVDAHSSSISSIACQPVDRDPLKPKAAKSKSATTLSEQISKENVPTLQVIEAAPGCESSEQERGRDSFSSQIISPLRFAADGLGVNSPSMSVMSNSSHISAIGSNASHDSMFSPLREHNSINSPGILSESGGGGRVGGGGSFTRTPVTNFNRSISSPLVSPLSSIREEMEIFDGDAASKLSKEAFTAAARGDSSRDVGEQLMMRANQITVASEVTSAFQSGNVVASTPFPSNAAAKDSAPPEPNGNSRSEQATSSDIRAVMTAFPRVLLETRVADTVDFNVLNAEKSNPPTTSQQLTNFQQEYLRSCIEEVMDDFCSSVRQQMWHLQYDMIRSFQNQKEEMSGLLRQYAVNDQLVQEVERLRKENEELRKYF